MSLTKRQEQELQHFCEGVVQELTYMPPGFPTKSELEAHRNCCTDYAAYGTKLADSKDLRLFVSHSPAMPDNIKDFILKLAAVQELQGSEL